MDSPRADGLARLIGSLALPPQTGRQIVYSGDSSAWQMAALGWNRGGPPPGRWVEAGAGAGAVGGRDSGLRWRRRCHLPGSVPFLPSHLVVSSAHFVGCFPVLDATTGAISIHSGTLLPLRRRNPSWKYAYPRRTVSTFFDISRQQQHDNRFSSYDLLSGAGPFRVSHCLSTTRQVLNVMSCLGCIRSTF